ncbi:hypothetical protein N0497_22065, partial [Pseudomonas aeruginosa]|nr:hypothetical protein [Pseudomonas aeruginosa]
IQRRVTTCGGRRKTQPTVRDGLTTTIPDGVFDANYGELASMLAGLVKSNLDIELGELWRRPGPLYGP